MKKFSNILLVSAVAGSLIATPVFAAPSVNDLRQDKSAAEGKVQSLQSELTSVMTKINQLEEDLVRKGQKVTEAEAKLEKAQKQEEKQREEMKGRIKAMYENGSHVIVSKVFESGSLADMLRETEYVRIVHNTDRTELEKYVEKKEEISEMKETLESDMENIQSMQEEFESEKESLDEKIEEAKEEIADFDKQIEAARQAAGQRASGGSDYVPPSNGGGAGIVNAAYSLLGVPYVWGGESGSGVDCSGLVKLAHKAVGVNLAHSSGSQGSGGRAVPSMEQALPGDVVCYSGHVGIYIGGGKMIHAPQQGDVVKVASVFGSPWFRRYW